MSMRASATLTLSELLTGRCNAHEPHLRGVRKFRKSSRLFSLHANANHKEITQVDVRPFARSGSLRLQLATVYHSHYATVAHPARCGCCVVRRDTLFIYFIYERHLVL